MTYIQQRNNTINSLISLEQVALPVAPAQPAELYPAKNKDGSIKRDKDGNPLPAFTGKNPSYLDRNGQPRLINHHKYDAKLPTAKELEEWFAHPDNGVCTKVRGNYIYIDLDLKNFEDKEACDKAAFGMVAKIQQLTGKEIYLEETHSGGWHSRLRVIKKPDFTLFSFTPGGTHVGEVLSATRIVVTAPTVGVSGNNYKIHQEGDPTATIESLEQIGIYSSKSPKQQAQKTTAPPILSVVPGSLALNELISKKNQGILNGDCPSGDRSNDITAALNDAYGWVHWANENGILISGSPEELAHLAGTNHGIDSERIARIIKSNNIDRHKPAAHYQGGDKSCWLKIYRLDRASFEEKCPPYIKAEIKAEWQQNRNVTVREATTGRIINNSSNQKVVSGNFNSSSGNGGSNGSGSGGNSNNGQPDWQYIYQEVEKLNNQGLSDAQFSAALLDFSQKSGLPLNGLKDIARQIERNSSRSTLLKEEEENFEKLLGYSNKKLDLYKALPESMAEPLLSKANSDRNDPLFVYMNFFVAVAMKLGSHIGLMAREGSSFEDAWIEFAILWMLAVAPPSGGKTQTRKTILRPIKNKQKKARNKFKQDLEKLEKIKAEWDSKPFDEKNRLTDTLENPKKFEEQIPKLRYEIIENGTPEAIFKRISENPPKSGTLIAYDEIIQVLALDQYKKVGDSRQQLMSSYSSPLSTEILRADDKNSLTFNDQTLCLIGNCPTSVVSQLFSDHDDGDGFGSRFDVAVSKTPENFAIWSDEKVSLNGLLDSTYEQLDFLPNELRELAGLPELDEYNQPTTVVIKFCPQAHERWTKLWEKFRRQIQKTETDNPAFSGYLGKAISGFLRKSLVLHCLSLVAGEENNPLEVSELTFERAEYLTYWHIGQFRLLQAQNDRDLSGTLLKIYEYASRKGEPISAEKIQSNLFRRGQQKPKLAEIRELMKKLAESGKATITGLGREIRLVVKKIKDVVIPTKSDKNYDTPQEIETPTEKGVQEFKEESYDNYDNSSTPDFPEESPPIVVESDSKEVVLSQPMSQELQESEDLILEECRNCRKSGEEDDSNADVETLSEDSELSEEVSEISRNYDNPSDEEEEDPDDDPDSDPPGGGQEPIAFTDEDEPVFEGSYAIVEAPEAPHEWKGQILWFVVNALPNPDAQGQTLVACESEPDIGVKTMPLKWLRLLKQEEKPIYLEMITPAPISIPIKTDTQSVKGRRIKCGEFVGTLVDKVVSGWVVRWENSKATLKKLGNPPTHLQDGDFEFI